MAGYDGFSMSNNARSAYEDGERPLSRWTKCDFLDAIEENCELTCDFDLLKKLPLEVMRDNFLTYTSRHHTSKFYNYTDFYRIDIDAVEELTNEAILQLLKEHREYKRNEREERKTEKKKEERWECSYLIWSGPRAHRRAKSCTEQGIVRGDWFYSDSGLKKKTSAKGFHFLRKIDSD